MRRRGHFLVPAGLALALIAAIAAAAPPRSGASPTSKRAASAADLAAQARREEDAEDYRAAAATLRALRGRVAPDADLELWLALFEARSGALDSARARLHGAILTAAESDTAPESRWKVYRWSKETSWTDGRWTGWHWYLWRARAELAAAAGDWNEALADARRAVAARPSSGADWYARALCAARIGLLDEAQECLAQAARVDPALPEPRYLSGVMAWRAGRRSAAQESFRAAASLDTTDPTAALALVHAGLPGSRPDSLPGTFLSGPRRAGLLTSPEGPKREAFRQAQVAPILMMKEDAPALTRGSDTTGAPPVRLVIAMLLDAEGRVVMSDVPDLRRTGLDPARVAEVLATLPRWQFSPATFDGMNAPAWAAYEFEFQR